jgi:hypothetical protein
MFEMIDQLFGIQGYFLYPNLTRANNGLCQQSNALRQAGKRQLRIVICSSVLAFARIPNHQKELE